MARTKERPWIFWVATALLHLAGLAVMPGASAAKRSPRPSPIQVERVAPRPTPLPPVAPASTPPPPSRPRTRRAAAPAKTLDRPEPTPPVTPEAPRKIVGLSLAATVEGTGPAFRLGETREGTTLRDPTPEPPASVPTGSPDPRPSGTGVAFTAPRRLQAVEPIYPDEYRERRIEGQVTLSLRIDPDGSVGEVEVVRPSPHAAFNRSALVTAKRERFLPATQGGAPVRHTIRCTYHFKLSS